MPQPLGWVLIAVGIVIFALGVLWLVSGAGFLGHLPGDIVIDRGNNRFYFPIVTCVVLSVLLSAVIWAIRLFRH